MDKIDKYIKKYQKQALDVIKNYMENDSEGKCLIKLPTGTGKTGVMAIASNLKPNNILVIVPNATLPVQTAYEIEENFWENIGYKPILIKKTFLIKSSIIDNIEKANDGLIYIVTIQTLLKIFLENIRLFTLIKENIDIIFYDEGHREPAQVWRNASRNLNKKMILFTATPYRNDNYVFNIDEKYKYEYSMSEAIANGDLKNIVFKPIPDDVFNSQKSIIEFIDKIASDSSRKILVRYRDGKNIKELVESLKSKYLIYGCHSKLLSEERLFSEGSQLIEYIKNKEFQILVHNDMLIEGVNIPELNTLVFFNYFENYKSVIQQIGRVLRVSDIPEAEIYVPELRLKEAMEQWQLYLLSEKNDEEYAYTGGAFKESFSFEKKSNLLNIMQFKKQANIYVSKLSHYKEMKEEIRNSIEELETLEKWKEEEREGNNFWVLCYELKEPSNVLKEAIWYDSSLEYVSVYEILNDENYYYFYFNTRRYALPGDYDDLKQVGIKEIYNLIPNGSDVRNVRYTSTSSTQKGPKTREIYGYSLEGIPANLTEKLSYCRNAIGKIENDENIIERYISTLTGKVSEREICSCDEYLLWCEDILRTMLNNRSSQFFNRFSFITDAPKTKATSLMLQFGRNVKYQEEIFYLDSQFCEIEYDKFEFEINGNKIKGKICRDFREKTYMLLDEERKYIVLDTDVDGNIEERELNQYINNGKFTVYYGEEQIIYTNGYYLKPNIKINYSDVNEYELWNSIYTIKELNDCKNEKLGDNPATAFNNTVKWPLDSVFGVLLDEIEKVHTEIDFLVCDDMGCEIADFIALSTIQSKVVLIHCKDKKSQISASAFQDVCGQAIKNVEYLLTTNPEKLPYVVTRNNKWNEKWVSENELYKTDRMIKGTVENFLDEYKKIMQKPYSQKEVWIVTTGLSKSKLKDELMKEKPKEQIPQLLYILGLTQDNLAQVEAHMKIFCKE
ncbi:MULTISPECIES: DEAD/DEAH box helicase [unclassified Lacrimispora]|uniref:DEAD/DEAH box helicase n=1 Tax=unclassified Lacrimispora TaxID=2719232 RepID=UPI00376F938C